MMKRFNALYDRTCFHKEKYEKVKNALDEVTNTGYGIVMPDIDELSLEEPEIVKQGGKYGVRLKAEAPSIHMMSANITTEFLLSSVLNVRVKN